MKGSKLVGLGLLGAVACALVIAPAAHADHHEKGDMKKMAKGSTMKDDVLFWMDDAESKLMQLAEATPQEKYGWRPMEGVRSQGEVFLHVAAANFGIPAFWGVKPPEGFAFEGYEQSMTSKADIQKALKESFAHVKSAFKSATDEDLNKMVKTFLGETTESRVYMLILSHQHEHLGQSIAYARSNGIVPPWSAKQQEEQKAEGN